MKNKRIRGDWYYILTVMYSVLTLFLIFLVVMSVYIQIYGLAIISAILLLASIIAVFINNSLGFNIQYKKGKIRYIGYGTEIKSIKIEEIDHVELQEAFRTFDLKYLMLQKQYAKKLNHVKCQIYLTLSESCDIIMSNIYDIKLLWRSR